MRPFVQHASFLSYRVQRDLALLILVVGACAIPFLSQPFHMDDNFYMDMARNARLNPLYPNDTPYVFDGQYLPDIGSHSHPPLQTYFLALIQRTCGEGRGTEWIYHSWALIFPFLGVIGFYFLCARFLERPVWPSLLLAGCPLFMVMQHNLMTDVPTLAFWLTAIASFIWAVDRKNRLLLISGSVCLFAAMFTSYQAAALVPLLGFYQWRRRGGTAGWVALLLPVVGMAAWFGLNYQHYHRFILSDTLGYIDSRHATALRTLGIKVIAFFEYQGWLVIFPIFLLYTWGRGLRWRLAGVSFLVALYLAQAAVPQYNVVDKLIFVIGIVTGFFVLVHLARFFFEALHRREDSIGMDPIDGQFLGFWYFGVAFYCILVLPEGSARYILPLVPPVLICFFRGLEVSEVIEYRSAASPILSPAMLASGALVISLAWGLLLSHADLEFARIYPRAAQESSRIVSGSDSFYGGEWGFRYYFSREGIRQLPTDESKVEGASWLLRPKLALPYQPSAALMSMTMPAQALSYEPATPLRLLDLRSPAGFYSTGWGLLPFSLSRKALEEVEIRQVNFMVEGLPRATVETSAGIPPWPGYLEIQGKSPLGLLLKPGTRVIFPWPSDGPLLLDLKCGIGPNSYREGLSRIFKMGAAQKDAAGHVFSSWSRDLNPGMNGEDRKWQDVQMLLPGRRQGGDRLEFSVMCSDLGADGTAAFAEAFLRHP